MRANRHSIALLLVVSVLLGHAQLQVKNFFSLTGKKNVPVTVVVQDGTGFLWLGTPEGVYKFDGVNPLSLTRGFPMLRQEISALFIDELQNTWIGTKSGKVYCLTKNRIDSIQFPEGTQSEKITSFANINSRLLIGTYGNGIYSWAGGKLEHYTSEQGLSDNVVYHIAGDKSSRIWCGTDAGITAMQFEGGKAAFDVISGRNGLPDNIVRDIAFQDNHLLIAMQDSGVCSYDLKTKKIVREHFFNNWSMGTVLNSLSSGGKTVVATERNGLLLFEKGGVTVYDYQQYLQVPQINQLFIDREKQLWVASKNGLSQFCEKRFNFINAARGLTDDNVLAVAMDNNNSIWIGSASGISRIVRDENGSPVVIQHDLGKYTISCAAKAPDGTIWFGTYGNGIVVVSPDKKKTTIATGSSDMMDKSNISQIFFPDKEHVYIATLGGGLIKARLTPESREKIVAEKVYTESDGLGSTYIYCVTADKNGKLYAGTDGGGLQVLENGRFTNLTQKFGFESNTVYSICSDANNTIWATTNEDGVIRYDGKKLLSIGSANGLRDEQPQQLYASGNTVFALNSKGIDKIDCNSNEISYYEVFDGDPEPNLNALYFQDNRLYCGTNNGLLIYRTSSESGDSVKPSVFIRSLSVNFKPFPLDSLYEYGYNQNNIQLGFDGIWLRNPGRLTFRYRLDGLENQWNYSGKEETVNYNNLPPGNYTFIVQVKNEEDVWSDPTGYSFIISKPIWQHWWFWVLVVAVVSVSVYSLIRYRLRALQRENLVLERRVKERTAQIEKQSRIIEEKNVELEQLSLVASKTDNVVGIFDARGRIEYVNDSFVKRNFMSLEDLKAKHGESLYELSNNPDIRNIVEDAVQNRRSVNYESLNKKITNGAEVWESSTLTPLFDEDGQLKKIIIIDTDVSERKKQEQIITQKNKDITDSISYARKIQHAILPSDAAIKAELPRSFVLYMTKDIVSGDFYWFSHFDTFSIIAAVDCTGHGVPGAFMSLIGYNLLNKIVNEQKITDPKDILLELNNGVLDALHKNEYESKDGMDIAICRINHREGTIGYAGAMRPLWIINNGVLNEVKADKIPIGTRQKDRDVPIAYTTHNIQVQKGDRFYIFTDGYADQFGGEKDKKYSSARFKELLISVSEQDFNAQEQRIRKEHFRWKGDNEQVDDILLIGFSL